jgi:hypothetical protein
MLKKILIALTHLLTRGRALGVATALRGVSAQADISDGAQRPWLQTYPPVRFKDDRGKTEASRWIRSQPAQWNQLRYAKPPASAFRRERQSFFPVLVFNNQLRGPIPGSMALVPCRAAPKAFGLRVSSVSQATRLPLQLGASLKQLAVGETSFRSRQPKSCRAHQQYRFTFFNIQGHQYDYDPAAQSLAITSGKLVVSKEFAQALGRPSEPAQSVGTISIGAVMQPIEITQLPMASSHQ